MFADDIVGIPFGGREVNMTECTWIRGKITRRERGTRVRISLSNRMNTETESP